jgi:hypothetical protein
MQHAEAARTAAAAACCSWKMQQQCCSWKPQQQCYSGMELHAPCSSNTAECMEQQTVAAVSSSMERQRAAATSM